MAQHSQPPKFGNWEGEENVHYTAYFENARKKKAGGGKMNSNEPPDNTPSVREQEVKSKGQLGTAAVSSKHEVQTNHDEGQLHRLTDSPLQHDALGQMSEVDLSHQRHGRVRSGISKVESESLKGSDIIRPRHERQLSQEEGGDLQRLTDSSLRHETVGRRASVDSPHHRHGGPSIGETPKRVSRQSAGYDRSIDHSPLHPHYQARVGGKVSGVPSPSWEKKVASEGSHGLAPSTPGRSRLRSITRGDDTPDNSPAVPKFGDWDESDPASAEGYSHIFDRVREEKQIGAGKVPVVAHETSYSNDQRQYGNDNTKSCCCFPWSRK